MRSDNPDFSIFQTVEAQKGNVRMFIAMAMGRRKESG